MKQQTANEEWIDVKDDSIMVELGFRKPILNSRDPSVWTKTYNERKILKNLRHSCKKDMHFHTCPMKFIPVKAKLIIWLKKNKKYPNTTYSKECFMHEIPLILSNYKVKDNSIVAKYSFNGRTYAPNEVPFWA